MVGQDRDGFSLVDLALVLLSYKWLILASVLVTTGLAAAVALLAAPSYKVETVLAPVSDESAGGAAAALVGQLGGLASLAGVELGSTADAKNQAKALLQSRTLTSRFIEDGRLLPILFASDWDSDLLRWTKAEAEPTLWMGIKAFDDVRSVSEDAQTGLVTLSIEWTDPSLAAEWIDTLTTMVNEEMRQRTIAEANRSLQFLSRELKATNVLEVQQAIYRMIEQQTQMLMLANVRDQYVFKVIDPPIAPDLDDPTSPRRGLLAALGVVLGLMLGVFLSLVANSVRVVRGMTPGKPHSL